MTKNIKDIDYSSITKMSYRLLAYRFGYSARISDIWEMLRIVYGFDEFEILNPREYQNGNFESFLADKYYLWLKGEDINFQDIEDAIMDVGDFTGKEKLLLTSGDMQERLWAIFLCLSDPTKNL